MVVNATDPEEKVTSSIGENPLQRPEGYRHPSETTHAERDERSCDSKEDLAFLSADRLTGETTRLRGELTSITFQGAPREGTRLGSRGGEWIPRAFRPLNVENTGVESARIGLIRPRCRQAPNVDPEDFEPAAPALFAGRVDLFGAALAAETSRLISLGSANKCETTRRLRNGVVMARFRAATRIEPSRPSSRGRRIGTSGGAAASGGNPSKNLLGSGFRCMRLRAERDDSQRL